jgi:mono/diheme cytochrome c family protein
MMKYLTVFGLFVGLGVALAQTATPVKIRRVSVTEPQSEQGEAMFRQYCATCHGVDGRGTGPAAAALQKRPADLTQLARKNNGDFPGIRVQRFIKGDDEVDAHGTRDMPIWGKVLARVGDGAMATMRVNALVQYVESIQAK